MVETIYIYVYIYIYIFEVGCGKYLSSPQFCGDPKPSPATMKLKDAYSLEGNL